MSEYEVVWAINVEADNSIDAAKKALIIQRDPRSIATVFEVEKRCNCGHYHGVNYDKVDVTVQFSSIN
jgi:hypothetical protein